MTIPLAPVLDTSAAGPLRTAIRQAVQGGEPLLLEGSMVERAGQACLQVLAAARATAAQLGTGFRIVEPSAPLVDMAVLAGLDDLLD